MKYGVRFCYDGHIDEDKKTDSLQEARFIAACGSRRNYEMEIVDLESGEVIKHVDPYCDKFRGVKSHEEYMRLLVSQACELASEKHQAEWRLATELRQTDDESEDSLSDVF